ncbi:phosphatidylglycerophosphatase A family protein [Neoehrlichia mikurensis]|nr:phosphatidylglycerophosphatase A [Neoehrlichia mikurensis]
MPLYDNISTWFGCGRVTAMPGTIGSLASVVFMPIVMINSIYGIIISLVVLFLGFWSIPQYLAHNSKIDDPKEVVIDEVLGQLIAFTLIILFIENNNKSILQNKLNYISIFFISFILFRFFDIIKVWPINIVDKNIKGALGIMLDDIIAAIMSIVSYIICYKFYHQYLG